MNDLDLDVFGDACEKAAGLIRQRRAGEQVAFQLSAALGEIGVRFQFARGLLNADQHAREPQPVGVGDKAPKAALLAGLMHELQPYRGKTAAAELRRLAQSMAKTATEMAALLSDGPAPKVVHESMPAQAAASKPAKVRVESPIPAGDDGLPDSALKVLRAAAAFYPGHLTVQQVATAADYSHKSSSFKRDWSLLRRAGYLQELGQGRFRATQGGCMRLGKSWQPIPKDFAVRVDFWKERLIRNEARILDAVAQSARGFTTSELADAVSLSATSSAFKAHVSNLKANDLIAKRGDRLVVSESLKNGVAHA